MACGTEAAAVDLLAEGTHTRRVPVCMCVVGCWNGPLAAVVWAETIGTPPPPFVYAKVRNKSAHDTSPPRVNGPGHVSSFERGGGALARGAMFLLSKAGVH